MKTRLGWPPRVGQSKEGNYTNNTNLSFFFKEKKKNDRNKWAKDVQPAVCLGDLQG